MLASHCWHDQVAYSVTVSRGRDEVPILLLPDGRGCPQLRKASTSPGQRQHMDSFPRRASPRRLLLPPARESSLHLRDHGVTLGCN